VMNNDQIGFRYYTADLEFPFDHLGHDALIFGLKSLRPLICPLSANVLVLCVMYSTFKLLSEP